MSIQFVEVSTLDGVRKRFAAGTKAGFAIERINNSKAEEEKKHSFIESVKEGEEAVVFGPDAELVNYGEGWTLRAVQGPEVKLLKPVQFGIRKQGSRDDMKAISPPIGTSYVSPPDLPPYKPPKERRRETVCHLATDPHAVGSLRVSGLDCPKQESKGGMAVQRKNVVNWNDNSPKWCWPVETESGTSYKQKRERNFVLANPEKRHSILTRIYCPSLTPAKQSVYNIDKM